MNKTDFQNMDQHVTILGWLHIAMNVLVLLIGAMVFVFVMLGGALSGDAEAAMVTTIVAFVVGGFMLLIAVPGLLTGWGLLKRKSWARILAIVMGFLNLLNFPLGTLMGVYTIWVLLQDGASDYFLEYKTA
jgi:hypothetical protein